MSTELVTQKAMRAVHTLPFCYLCGHSLDADLELNNEDHVPPQVVFLKEDRNFPLLLPTHKKCNEDRSQDDQVVGYLVGLLHGHKPDAEHSKLKFGIWTDPAGKPALSVSGLDLRGVIRRWVRGFHAALYREPIPDDPTSFQTFPPLQEAEAAGGTATAVPVAGIIPKLVELIKKNRLTGTIDRIVCRNGKLRYECVWTQGDGGQWFCTYALDVCGWTELGVTPSSQPRGCVGTYRRPGAGTPVHAATATPLEFPVPNEAKLDPFGD